MLCNTDSLVKTLSLFLSIVVTLLISFQTAQAEEKGLQEILKQDLWGNIYKDGGQCFYTKKAFTKNSPLLSESYVYSESWVRDHLKCGTNRQCKRESPEYVKILSDLHNLVIAKSTLSFKLKTSTFGILDESIDKDEYGMRTHLHLVEPRNEIKGDIARIIYYMHKTYDLPIRGNLPDFILWNELDPPSEEEKARNDLVESIQGTRNPYVDDPSLVKREDNS